LLPYKQGQAINRIDFPRKNTVLLVTQQNSNFIVYSQCTVNGKENIFKRAYRFLTDKEQVTDRKNEFVFTSLMQTRLL
jgi:hypothetical protein